MGVRIFNLSVNIINRRWNEEAKRTHPRKSWIARAIDRISRDYDVVFVVSTGNILKGELSTIINTPSPYPNYFSDESACLFDPAQAALALTVGSVAPTTLVVGNTATLSAIAERDQPSPFTRSGPGVARDNKPELVEYGGNYAWDSGLRRVLANQGCDVLQASHKLTPAISHQSGTSFAAPRVSFKLAMVLSRLSEFNIVPSASLLKAFLVNSASYRGEENSFRQLQTTLCKDRRAGLYNVLGYGFPDHVRATDSDAYSAIMFYQGELTPEHTAFLDIPVPASMAETSGLKRLTVTVVYAPEVQRWGLESYLGATLKWRMYRGDTDKQTILSVMSHEADEDIDDSQGDDEPSSGSGPINEIKFRPDFYTRSRGTVQHGIHEWTDHKSEFSDNHYTLAITAFERWKRTSPPSVPFAVVVRLEDVSRSTQIYSDIEAVLARVEVEAET